MRLPIFKKQSPGPKKRAFFVTVYFIVATIAIFFPGIVMADGTCICEEADVCRELTFKERVKDNLHSQEKKQYAIHLAGANGIDLARADEHKIDSYLEAWATYHKQQTNFVEPWKRAFFDRKFLYSPLNLNLETLNNSRSRDYVFTSTQIGIPEIQRASQSVIAIEGAGSAVVVAPGYILTNEHVIDGLDLGEMTVVYRGEKISVRNASRVRSQLLTEDLDLAILYVPQLETVQPIKMASSDAVIDQPLISIGYPAFFAGQMILTTGARLCFKEDESNPFHNFKTENVIRSTNWIFPGNSGGVLVNKLGELEGLVFAVYADDHIAVSYRVSVIKYILRELHIRSE